MRLLLQNLIPLCVPKKNFLGSACWQSDRKPVFFPSLKKIERKKNSAHGGVLDVI